MDTIFSTGVVAVWACSANQHASRDSMLVNVTDPWRCEFHRSDDKIENSWCLVGPIQVRVLAFKSGCLVHRRAQRLSKVASWAPATGKPQAVFGFAVCNLSPRNFKSRCISGHRRWPQGAVAPLRAVMSIRWLRTPSNEKLSRSCWYAIVCEYAGLWF